MLSPHGIYYSPRGSVLLPLGHAIAVLPPEGGSYESVSEGGSSRVRVGGRKLQSSCGRRKLQSSCGRRIGRRATKLNSC